MQHPHEAPMKIKFQAAHKRFGLNWSRDRGTSVMTLMVADGDS